MLHVTDVKTVTDLFALESEWRALWEQCPSATPFESPDWLLPWVRSVWGGGCILTIVLRDGGELIGVAPFFVWREREERKVSLLGSGITDYLGITVAPDYREEAADRVLRYLAERNEDWDVADLQELPPDSPLLTSAVPDGLEFHAEPCSVCPVVSLPDRLDTFVSGLAPKFRTNLRRRDAHLREHGVELVTATVDTTEQLMRSLFDLHAARWEEKQQGGVLQSEALRNFHLDVACRFARLGMLRLYGLRAGGELIGVQYNLAAKRRFYFYLHGFDPRWSTFSPGSQLIFATVAKAIEEGATEMDFLRKTESYKYSWGAKDRLNYRLVVSRVPVASCA